MVIDEPSLSWEGQIPRSLKFDDIYYSPESGLQESKYVFLKQNYLEERWLSNKEQSKTFVIAETGFGTGLNFLATCLLWKNLEKKPTSLHFISFEKFPLTKEDLTKALSNFPETKTLAQRLIEIYPKRIAGLHHIEFDQNIKLSLYFGDALSGLQSLDSNRIAVDAWFFDGFSPSQNDELWSDSLFSACKNFNKKGSTFSTFTSAGHVKRKLEAIGFTCNKVKGFGNKREMLCGSYNLDDQKNEQDYGYEQKPWFIKQNKNHEQVKTVAIIGAGLAGCWSARKLAERKIKVKLFDSNEDIAQGASGNPRGATYFKLENQENEYSPVQQFYLSAFLYALRNFDHYFSGNKQTWHKSGLLQLISREKESQIFNSLKVHNPFQEIAYPVDKDHASELSGFKQAYDALYFPEAGNASPQAMCKLLCHHENIIFSNNQEINALEYHEQQKKWSVKTIHTEITEKFDAVIIANSYCANAFSQSKTLPLHSVRGQSTQLSASNRSQQLKTVICAKGYLTPALDGTHSIGSTFDPRNKNSETLEQDNQTNLEYLKAFSADFYQSLEPVVVSGAKTAFRCQTPDMLPVLGQLCDYETFFEDFQGIAKGQLKRRYPAAKYIPGLYINTGHASRGLISSPYCAEILAAEICDEIPACETLISEYLSPARFYYRELKKSGNKENNDKS